MIKKGIQLNNRQLVNTILYADDQILMATSEDDLQTMASPAYAGRSMWDKAVGPSNKVLKNMEGTSE